MAQMLINHRATADGTFTTTGATNWNDTHDIASFKAPYGSLSDSTIQTIADIAVAYPITFDTNEELYLVTHSTSVNPSRITLDEAGTYFISYTAVFDITGGANDQLEIWLRVDGTNVPRSNSVFSISAAVTEGVGACTYIYTFTAGQYFELVMRGDTTAVQLLSRAAGTTPTRPAIPSIICTVNRISF